MSFDITSRRTAIFGLMALGGCGFAPVYGEGNSLRDATTFETDDSVAGFRMGERLEQRLGAAGSPRFVVTVTQSQSQTQGAITNDGDIVRFNLIGNAKWKIASLADGTVLAQGEVDSFNSYSATGSTVATQASNTDASARLSVALADKIVARLLVLDIPA